MREHALPRTFDSREVRRALYPYFGLLALAGAVGLCGLELFLELVQPAQPTSSPALNIMLAALVILPPLAFVAVGLIIVRYRSRNTTGWVMCAIGFVFSLGVVTTDLPDYLYHHQHARGGLMLVAAVIGNVVWSLFGLALGALLLLFPTGRSLPGWWSRVLPWGGVLTLVFVVINVVAPGTLSPVPVENPLALSFVPAVFGQIAVAPPIIVVLLGLAGIIRRFRLSRGEERQQLKWFTYSTALAVVFFFGSFGSSGISIVITSGYFLAIAMVPVAIGIAILKYRLWDIDLLINRTLVYGSLTVTLAAFYIGVVVALQAILRLVTGQTTDLAIAVATLVVAAAFNPWRRRLQSFIDRRFYRRRYDAVRTLAALSTALRDETDLEQISARIVHVLGETMQPEQVSLWLAETN